MKKTRLSVLATTALLASSIIVPTASAQYLEGQEIKDTEGLEYRTLIAKDIEESVENQKFIQINGKINKITKETSGNYYGTVDGDNPFGFYFDESTVILNNHGEKVTLEEGMQFSAYVDSSKPMMMIYPPRYSPEVIIAHTSEVGTVQLDQFDENYLNKKQDLVINVSKDTNIINLSGEELSETDIINKNVIIFYEYLLKSYPAQTGPSKIIVLDPSNEELAYNIVEHDHYVINGVKMIPLRLISEQLGYKVETIENGAIISKGALSYTIIRGEKQYGNNKSLKYFPEEPVLLEYGKTYVPYEFLELLIGEK